MGKKNRAMEMEGNRIGKVIPAHLLFAQRPFCHKNLPHTSPNYTLFVVINSYTFKILHFYLLCKQGTRARYV